MQAKLDHVVLWVADPNRSLEFYVKVVGLTPVRADEFREGKAPFPSVRVSSDSIIDLMAKVAAPIIDHMVGVSGTAGNLASTCASPWRAMTSKRCASGWLTLVSACRL
jgi:glyoxylase I family protein